MSKTKSEQTLFSIVDNGGWWMTSAKTEGLSRSQIRRIQATLIRFAIGLDGDVLDQTPEEERIRRQIDVSRALAVDTTQAEVDDGGDFALAAMLRVMRGIEDCEIDVEDEDVTDPWLTDE